MCVRVCWWQEARPFSSPDDSACHYESVANKVKTFRLPSLRLRVCVAVCVCASVFVCVCVRVCVCVCVYVCV